MTTTYRRRGLQQEPEAAAPTAGVGLPPTDAAPLPHQRGEQQRIRAGRKTRWFVRLLKLLLGFLQLAAMAVVGFAKAAWAVAVPLARVAYRVAVWMSPVLVWVFWKYIDWYVLSYFKKAMRTLGWAKWLARLLGIV